MTTQVFLQPVDDAEGVRWAIHLSLAVDHIPMPGTRDDFTRCRLPPSRALSLHPTEKMDRIQDWPSPRGTFELQRVEEGREEATHQRIPSDQLLGIGVVRRPRQLTNRCHCCRKLSLGNLGKHLLSHCCVHTLRI